MPKGATQTVNVHSVDSAPVAISRVAHVTQGPAVISTAPPVVVAQTFVFLCFDTVPVFAYFSLDLLARQSPLSSLASAVWDWFCS